MPLRFTNTLTGQKEEFRPLHPPRVTMYVCGVTVYDDCHIGHARGAVVFDVLRRFLAWRGFEVAHVRNITDVDDKIIDRARGLTPELRELESAGGRGLTPLDLRERTRTLAEHFTKRFREDFSHLQMLPPTHEPRATEYIPQMVRFIEALIREGIAYEGSDGVYFAVRKLTEYGQLSHQRPDEMLEGARAEAGEGKKDPFDFALWKKAKPEEPSSAEASERLLRSSKSEAEPAWESPWGPGRPGWHIECSTMSTALLGDSFDIHGGGQDLIFPHHENERAQALAAGKPFARYWLHNGLLTVGGRKMAKSLGNFVTVDEALKRHPNPDVLRLFFLSAHYRSPLDFTWERYDEASRAYDRLTGFLLHAERFSSEEGVVHQDVRELENNFRSAMEDDLNTPEALAALFEMAKAAEWEPTPQRMKGAAQRGRELGAVLGLFQAQEEMGDYVQHLLAQREKARQRKDYAEADVIRRRLLTEGYLIEDTARGTVVRRRP